MSSRIEPRPLIAPLARRRINRVLWLYLPLLLGLVYILFPIYWTVNTSLIEEKDLFTQGIQFYPHSPTLANYKMLWSGSNLGQFFINSFLVAGATCLLLIPVAVLSGYAMAKFRFRGKIALILLFLATQMFPGVLVIIPLFVMMSRLGLTEHWIALILPYAAFDIPFSTILMRGFFLGVPDELEESAMVDGCSRFGAFMRISLPLTLPGIVATGIFAFIAAWNELLLAVLLINDQAKMTLPAGLNLLRGEFEINWGLITAASVIALVPAMVLFGFIQRYLVKGLSTGAVKG